MELWSASSCKSHHHCNVTHIELRDARHQHLLMLLHNWSDPAQHVLVLLSQNSAKHRQQQTWSAGLITDDELLSSIGEKYQISKFPRTKRCCRQMSHFTPTQEEQRQHNLTFQKQKPVDVKKKQIISVDAFNIKFHLTEWMISTWFKKMQQVLTMTTTLTYNPTYRSDPNAFSHWHKCAQSL